MPFGSPQNASMHSTIAAHEEAIALTTAKPEDFEALAALRIEAMRESLERIGRFDPARARERFNPASQPSARDTSKSMESELGLS